MTYYIISLEASAVQAHERGTEEYENGGSTDNVEYITSQCDNDIMSELPEEPTDWETKLGLTKGC